MSSTENSTNNHVTAVVPTRDRGSYDSCISGLWDMGVEVIVQGGKDSIFDIIDSIVHMPSGTPGFDDWRDDDIIILAHDDIKILSTKEVFDYCLSPLKDKETGFVGVAGTQFLKKECIWWDGVRGNPSVITPLAGGVYHGNSLEDMSITTYGHGNKRKVIVMDGLFLAATVRTWRSVRLKKPDSFSGKWDFYDIYYTFQAHMKGLNNYVMPLSILHTSLGDISDRQGWHDNKAAFQKKYSKHLPCIIQ